MPIIDLEKLNAAKNTILELNIDEVHELREWLDGLVATAQLKLMFPKAPITFPMPEEKK